MKYLLVFSLSLFAFVLSAQSGTSLDEYRYLSKGYAYQLEMGLDPNKKGYDIRTVYTAKNGAVVTGLYQTDRQELSALLVSINDKDGKPYYSVVPNPASDKKVQQMYEGDFFQIKNKKVHLKLIQAKDEYLFALATGRISNQNTVQESIITQKTTTTQNPVTYDNFPNTTPDQLTAKGGATRESNHESITPAVPKLDSPGRSDTNNSGTTITGQVNAELNTRTVLVEPFTQHTSKASGRVMIKFCVNAEGTVTFAKFTQRGSTTLNSRLKTLALEAVRNMRLSPSATTEDCGTVGFEF